MEKILIFLEWLFIRRRKIVNSRIITQSGDHSKLLQECDRITFRVPSFVFKDSGLIAEQYDQVVINNNLRLNAGDSFSFPQSFLSQLNVKFENVSGLAVSKSYLEVHLEKTVNFADAIYNNSIKPIH